MKPSDIACDKDFEIFGVQPDAALLAQSFVKSEYLLWRFHLVSGIDFCATLRADYLEHPYGTFGQV